jgi:MFS family permease
MFRTAWTAGDIIGPIMGTYLYDLFRFKQFQLAGITLPGYGLPYFINSSLTIVTTILLLALVREPHRPTE